MLPSNEDVAGGFIVAWPLVANGYLDQQIPVERVCYGVVSEGTSWPNARITVELSKIERTSGPVCLVWYSVTIDANTYDTDSGKLTAALQVGFECSNRYPLIDVANTSNVISVKNIGGSKMEVGNTSQRRDGVDLKKISTRYELLLQGELPWPGQ